MVEFDDYFLPITDVSDDKKEKKRTPINVVILGESIDERGENSESVLRYIQYAQQRGVALIFVVLPDGSDERLSENLKPYQIKSVTIKNLLANESTEKESFCLAISRALENEKTVILRGDIVSSIAYINVNDFSITSTDMGQTFCAVVHSFPTCKGLAFII